MEQCGIGRGCARTVVLPEAVWVVGPPQQAGEYDRLGVHERAIRARLYETNKAACVCLVRMIVCDLWLFVCLFGWLVRMIVCDCDGG